MSDTPTLQEKLLIEADFLERRGDPTVRPLIERLREAAARLDALEAALREIASYPCCESPGCNEDDPLCMAMHARAALKGETP